MLYLFCSYFYRFVKLCFKCVCYQHFVVSISYLPALICCILWLFVVHLFDSWYFWLICLSAIQIRLNYILFPTFWYLFCCPWHFEKIQHPLFAFCSTYLIMSCSILSIPLAFLILCVPAHYRLLQFPPPFHCLFLRRLELCLPRFPKVLFITLNNILLFELCNSFLLLFLVCQAAFFAIIFSFVLILFSNISSIHSLFSLIIC